jgi:predicted RNA-binding protein YlqC (UPF0109 family)
MTPNPKTSAPLLIALMKALLSEPEKLVTEAKGSSLAVQTWKQDHARLVGKGGETIYALRKIGEYLGVRLTLKDPEHQIQALVTPAPEFDAVAMVKQLHAAAGDTAEVEADDIEGMTAVAVRGSELAPDFARAVTLICRKIGTITKRPIEIVYE